MAINEVTNKARGAVVLMSYPELCLLEQQVHEETIHMPYIPGLLSFREAPSIVGLLTSLQSVLILLWWTVRAAHTPTLSGDRFSSRVIMGLPLAVRSRALLARMISHL